MLIYAENNSNAPIGATTTTSPSARYKRLRSRKRASIRTKTVKRSRRREKSNKAKKARKSKKRSSTKKLKQKNIKFLKTLGFKVKK